MFLCHSLHTFTPNTLHTFAQALPPRPPSQLAECCDSDQGTECPHCCQSFISQDHQDVCFIHSTMSFADTAHQSKLSFQHQLLLIAPQCLTLSIFSPSQNHRGLGVGRNPRRSSTPTRLLEHVPLTTLYRKASGWVLNISGEGCSTPSLDSLFQCSVNPLRKEDFPHASTDLSAFHFVPFTPGRLLSSTEKSLAPST